MDPTVARLRQTLPHLGDPGRAEQARRYLKSNLEFWGVALPELRVELKQALSALPHAPRRASPAERGARAEAVLTLAEALWTYPVHELRVMAMLLLEHEGPALTGAGVPPADKVLLRLDPLIRDSRTWAYVDSLAVHTVGVIVDAERAVVNEVPADNRPGVLVLDRWIDDPDFWVRRTALLALLQGVRKKRPDLRRLFRYAERLLPEREFFLRKAVGWTIREVGDRDPDAAAAFVAEHALVMSGLSFREATRKLTPDVQARLGALRRDGAN